MTVSQTLKAIEVMQAFTEGKQIQVRSRTRTTNIVGMDSDYTSERHPVPGWVDIHSSWGYTPSWDWEDCEYRVYQD